MNLPNIECPDNFEGMLDAYEQYYTVFYHEMVRMSNIALNDYISKFLELVLRLAKSSDITDSFRVAVGITALHRFGYNEFQKLTDILEIIIPQKDLALVKFTSWCTGELVKHPGTEQAKYVGHLIHRIFGWIHAYGRRERYLAAAWMIYYITLNAPSSVSSFLPQIQAATYVLITRQSFRIIEATISALSQITFAVISYRRSEIENLMLFFHDLCLNLMSMYDPNKQISALQLLTRTAELYQDYFVSRGRLIMEKVSDILYDCQPMVNIHAIELYTQLIIIDPILINQFAMDDYFRDMEQLLVDFPNECSKCIIKLIDSAPSYIKEQRDEILTICETLIEAELYDDVFMIFHKLLKVLEDYFDEMGEDLLRLLASAKLSEYYKNFFVALTKLSIQNEDMVIFLLNNKIKECLESEDPLIVLKMISELPSSIFPADSTLLTQITKHANSKLSSIRIEVSRALFNVLKSQTDISPNAIVLQELQRAISDPDLYVRAAIIQCVGENCPAELASSEGLNWLRVFLNDDSTNVRINSIKALAKINRLNPVKSMAFSRNYLINCIYILENIPSIRQKARTAKILPHLIESCKDVAKMYINTFLKLFSKEILETHDDEFFENFIEQNSSIIVKKGFIDAIALLAPLDMELFSQHSSEIIPNLCQYLMRKEPRELILSVLNLLYILLSPLNSTKEIRSNCASILTSCTNLLLQTKSRELRMGILKVVGAIGLLDVHFEEDSRTKTVPDHVDADIARRFYIPMRDDDVIADSSLYLEPGKQEVFFGCYVTQLLLNIFNDINRSDLTIDTCDAMVHILQNKWNSLLPAFDKFYKFLLQFIQESETPEELAAYCEILIRVSNFSGSNIVPFLEETLSLLMSKFTSDDDLLMVRVVYALVETAKDAFAPHYHGILCHLLSALENRKTSDAQVCDYIMKIFVFIAPYSSDQIFLVISQICDAIIFDQSLDAVRISGLNALKALADITDMMFAIGIIVRSLQFTLFDLETKSNTTEAAIGALVSLIKNYGKPFLFASSSILNRLKQENIYTPELMDAITKVELGRQFEDAKQDKSEKKPKQVAEKFVINEELLIIRSENPNFGDEMNLQHWLYNFIKIIVSQNPRSSIRACSNLVAKSEFIAMRLFNVSFLSIWPQLSQKTKKVIQTSFKSILDAKESYTIVGRRIITLLIYMDKMRQPIDIPIEVIIKSCEKYSGMAYALYMQEQHQLGLTSPKDKTRESVEKLIKIYCDVGQKENAICLFKNSHENLSNSIETKMRLGFYEECIEPLKKQLKKPANFALLINCLASMSKWEDITNYITYFNLIDDRQTKISVAAYLAEATMRLERWDDLRGISEFTIEDNSRNIIVNALKALHDLKFDVVNDYVERGFSLIASKPMAIWSEYQQIQDETVILAQKLVELHEIAEWMRDTENRSHYENTWTQRHMTMPRDFSTWSDMLSNRILMTNVHDENLIKMFMLPGIYQNSFTALFPLRTQQSGSIIIKICEAIQNWRNMNKESALGQLDNIMNEFTDDTPKNIKAFAEMLYGTWISEIHDGVAELKKAYQHLNKATRFLDRTNLTVITVIDTPPATQTAPTFPTPMHKRSQSFRKTVNFGIRSYGSKNFLLTPSAYRELMTNVLSFEVIRKWALVAAELINVDPPNADKYVKTAIECLTSCANTSSTSFPDVVQLLNIFFEYANKWNLFAQTKESIRSLDTRYLLAASPQLLVQLSHSSSEISMFVAELVLSLLEKHYHSIVFSVITMQESSIEKRSIAALNIIDKFRYKMPEEMNEVDIIRDALIDLTVTLHEKCQTILGDIQAHIDDQNWNLMKDSLDEMEELYPTEPKNELEYSFCKEFKKSFEELRALNKADRTTSTMLNQINAWVNKFNVAISNSWNKVESIALNTVSPELCEMNEFSFAVPGTYKVDHEINRIKFFFEQVMVFTSKQKPKSISVMGSDGKVYQYLLKGHEDLRLDERIMQFFSTVNSIIKTSFSKSTVIKTMVVMPLSKLTGMVQWVNGADTLKTIVEQYRSYVDPQKKSPPRDPLEEYKIATDIGIFNYNNLPNIQKMAILQKVFDITPDTDIANFLWLKSRDAEHWLLTRRTFAVSCAVNSAIGYIIGLGDRHPSNIMVDKNTGKMIHIDFGDCFETAMKRKILPEVVPFRLTRMIVKAMGAAKTGGTFRSMFIDYMTVLRENWRVLILVLAVFVHEPLVESNDSTLLSAPSRLKRIGSAIDAGMQVVQEIDDAESIRIRVKNKLLGNDFGKEAMSVADQTDKLIASATNIYNLSKMYSGWCPFW